MTAIIDYDLGRILLENTDDLLYVLNETFICEQTNLRQHQKELGYSSINQKFIEFIYYSDNKRCLKFLNEILKEGKAVEQLRIKHNEKYEFYKLNGNSFKDSLGNTKILIIARNISIYKDLENAWEIREKSLKELADSLPEIRFWKLLQTKSEKTSFQKSREMLDLVIDNLPHFIYWKDKDLRYLGCNQSYASVNSLKDPNYIVGKKDEDISWARYNLDRIKESEKNVIVSNLNQELVESWFLPDGSKAWFDINRIPLHNLEGNVVGILSTYHDITSRVVAEKKLKESEIKYRSILENIGEGYFEVDLKGVFVFCNSSLTSIMGYSSQELIDKNYTIFTDELNREKIYKVYNQVFKTGKPQKHFQFQFYHKDGQKIIAETSVYLKYDQEGKKVGFYGIVQDISDKFLLEQKLKKSEEKYRHLFNKSPFSIWLLNLDGKLVDCNLTFTKFLSNYTEDDIIGKHYIEVLSLFDQQEILIPFFKNKFEAFVDDAKLEPVEFKLRRANGKYLWIDIRSSKIKLENETLIQVLIQDITEKKDARLKLQRSEEDLKILNKELENIVLERTRELQESEAKFRNIAEQTTLGIVILQKGYVVYTNQALSDITGYSSEEISKWTRNKFVRKIHPDDLPFVLEQLQKKLDGDMDFISHYACRIITKSKSIKWIELHAKAITYQHEIADFITFVDITDKMEAEQRLKESETKYRHLYEKSPYGIALVNLEGIILDINSTISSLFGYTRDDLIGQNYLNLLGIFPDTSQVRTMPRFLSQLNSNEIVKPKLTQIYTKNGSKVWVESEISEVSIGTEKIVQAIIQDVTEKIIAEKKLQESERKLREQNIELRELDRLKTDFISIAAHELKTPLISIGGYIDLILLREKELKDEVYEDLNRVLQNVHRLEDYINRLLDVMKIDAKKMELVKIEENVYEIIENCIAELELHINQKKLKIDLNVDNPLTLPVDSFRISQVFSNLFSNAVKFTPEGGKIEINADKQDGRYIFRVRDTGKGLTPDEIEKLFGKFVMIGRKSENFSTFDKGSGLGLYIAKGIIEAHGGKIHVESKGIDKGSEFIFELPSK